MKILFHCLPTFLSSNPKIRKAVLKTFPTNAKPTKCPAKEINEARKAKKRGGEKAKSKSQDCCVTFKPKNYKLSFLRISELRKLTYRIWIRTPRSVRPVNRFVVSFSSLWHDIDQKTARLASKRVLRQTFQGRTG